MKDRPTSHASLTGRGRNSHPQIDALLPSSNQKAALVGSLGTPSLHNPYVTASDFGVPRLLPTQLALETGGGLFHLWHPSLSEVAWDGSNIGLKWSPTNMSAADNEQKVGRPFSGYMSFNGTDEHIEAASTATNHHNMHPSHKNVEVVIGRLHPWGTGNLQWIACKYDNVAMLREWYLLYDAVGQHLKWYVGETDTWDGDLVAVSKDALVLGKWFIAFCTCRIGEPNTITLWQEGTTVASMTVGVAAKINTQIRANSAARCILAARDASAAVDRWAAMDLALVFHKRQGPQTTPWWNDVAQMKTLVRMVMPNFCIVT